MHHPTSSSTYWQVVLWGREPRTPIATVSPKWFAIGTVLSALIGLQWLTLLVLATWNGLVPRIGVDGPRGV